MWPTSKAPFRVYIYIYIYIYTYLYIMHSYVCSPSFLGWSVGSHFPSPRVCGSSARADPCRKVELDSFAPEQMVQRRPRGSEGLRSSGSLRRRPWVPFCSYLAVGQNQWYHFGVGAPPILEHLVRIGIQFAFIGVLFCTEWH